jgi:hypothetical protein
MSRIATNGKGATPAKGNGRGEPPQVGMFIRHSMALERAVRCLGVQHDALTDMLASKADTVLLTDVRNSINDLSGHMADVTRNLMNAGIGDADYQAALAELESLGHDPIHFLAEFVRLDAEMNHGGGE